MPPRPKQTEDFLLVPIDAKCVEHLKEPLVRKLDATDVSRLSQRFEGSERPFAEE